MKTKLQFLVIAASALFVLGTAAALPLQQMQPLTITDGPRIEDVSSHSAEIAWTTSSGGSSVVHYGIDPNNLSQTAQTGYVQSTAGRQHATHRVKIDNLQPDTTYYFSVESAQGQGSGTSVKSPVQQFMSSGAGASDKVPVYRAYSSTTGSHVLTPSYQEYRNAISSYGYQDEGVAFYISRKQGPSTEPLYRLYNPNTKDRVYTANAQERSNIAQGGAQDEGVVGYIATTQQPGTVPLYQMINPSGLEHFYTAAPAELQRDQQAGWKNTGIIGYVWQH